MSQSTEELRKILDAHKKWLNDEDGGKRANLIGANLIGASLIGASLGGADLRDAYLRDADLGGADLRDADLRGASLSGASLSGASLSGADLRDAYLRDADLRDADLRDADLRGANLIGADLRDADLGGADLRDARLNHSIGDKTYVKSMQIEEYSIVYTSYRLFIGCKSFSFDEWKEFSDAEISRMDSGALEWWKKWKDTIFKIIEMSPSEPTRENK